MSLRQIRAIPHNAIMQQLGYPMNLIAVRGAGAAQELLCLGRRFRTYALHVRPGESLRGQRAVRTQVAPELSKGHATTTVLGGTRTCRRLRGGGDGLLDLFGRIGATDSRRVYPDFAQVARYAWLAGDRRLAEIGIKTYQQRGEGTDFKQLAEYRIGDPPRHRGLGVPAPPGGRVLLRAPVDDEGRRRGD